MAIAVQIDPEKAPAGCCVPTIVPVGEFYPGQVYDVTDEQGEALLALPDGPFVRSTLKAARASEREQERESDDSEGPATAPEAHTTAPSGRHSAKEH